METFVDVLMTRVRQEPDHVAYRFFKGPALRPEVMTMRSLWEHAAGLARVLQARSLTNERVLLACRSEKHFIVAFFACLLANAVAVPAAAGRRQSFLKRTQFLAHDACAGAIISDCKEADSGGVLAIADDLIHFDIQRYMQSDDHAMLASRWTAPGAAKESLALLQYTSGSTGNPKGVAITHANLLHNCASMHHAMGLSAQSVGLVALPLFHDMGLIGGVLQPIYSGFSIGFMSPAELVKYPERWLQIISAYQVTVSGGPNYMYELAARTITDEDLHGLDLSSWRVAFCGAEPIRPATLSKFAKRFAPFGFSPEAFLPCYGMAESTLFVTSTDLHMPLAFATKKGLLYVGCGRPRPDMRVEMVDPQSRTVVPEGCGGEIWVSGPSVASGYWMQPDLTMKTFHAKIAGQSHPCFLRTGDLGYVSNGQLYVTGRLKDLIIINGKKYSPQDLEEEAEHSHPGLRHSGGAAFSVTEDEREHLVIVFELNREWVRRPDEWQRIISAIRSAIRLAYDLVPRDIVLIKPGALPRTSSGKVRRSQSRTDYLACTLDRVGNCQRIPA